MKRLLYLQMGLAIAALVIEILVFCLARNFSFLPVLGILISWTIMFAAVLCARIHPEFFFRPNVSSILTRVFAFFMAMLFYYARSYEFAADCIFIGIFPMEWIISLKKWSVKEVMLFLIPVITTGAALIHLFFNHQSWSDLFFSLGMALVPTFATFLQFHQSGYWKNLEARIEVEVGEHTGTNQE